MLAKLSSSQAELRVIRGAKLFAYVIVSGLVTQPELNAQIAPQPQVRHSTYDFTEGPMDPNQNLTEAWVDAKAMPDGTTYQVGTVGCEFDSGQKVGVGRGVARTP